MFHCIFVSVHHVGVHPSPQKSFFPHVQHVQPLPDFQIVVSIIQKHADVTQQYHLTLSSTFQYILLVQFTTIAELLYNIFLYNQTEIKRDQKVKGQLNSVVCMCNELCMCIQYNMYAKCLCTMYK